jgi:hypothetical protein
MIACVDAPSIFTWNGRNILDNLTVTSWIGSLSLFLEHVMVTNPELEGKVNKGTCLDHVCGLEFLFAVVPLEEGKHQQLLAREMQHGTDPATRTFPWDLGNCLRSLAHCSLSQAINFYA